MLPPHQGSSMGQRCIEHVIESLGIRYMLVSAVPDGGLEDT